MRGCPPLSFLALLLVVSSHKATARIPSNFSCPSTQRYDVAKFPPRCLDCPHVVPNKMDLSLIKAIAHARRAPPKFSPGLPQNGTCGCWRAPVNQTIDIALNMSWVVSGLVFEGPTRKQWLREINIEASEDNTTFIGWGVYTSNNFTSSALTVFKLPVRARFFRITVLRYVNHLVNESGFPIAVSALVSQDEPFGCSCPLLSSGQCCPFENMTVHNDTCVWCMDPTQITTVMVNGCGKCKQGTFENEGRCLFQRKANANNRLDVDAISLGGDLNSWSANVNVTTEDPRTAVILFLTRDTEFVHPCVGSSDASCIVKPLTDNTIVHIAEEAHYSTQSASVRRLDVFNISKQYLQFDRGRYILVMTLPTLLSWAQCTETSCKGALGALFLTIFDNGSFKAQSQLQPLHFQRSTPELLFISTAPTLVVKTTKIELHTYLSDRQQWVVRIVGIQLRGDCIYLQWDSLPVILYNQSTDGEFIPIDPPPRTWTTLRVTEGYLNSTTLMIQQPVTVVKHDALTLWKTSDITVRVRHGFNFEITPKPGDSEQIIIVTATCLRPIRLKRLSTTSSQNNGLTTFTYTTSKGFISDPTKVLDLGIACTSKSMAELIGWIQQAAMFLPNDNPLQESFVKASCAQAASVSKSYWMVAPNDYGESRTQKRPITVVAEFI